MFFAVYTDVITIIYTKKAVISLIYFIIGIGLGLFPEDREGREN
jgi:hypothetical protein